jgi:hypothetical protein
MWHHIEQVKGCSTSYNAQGNLSLALNINKTKDDKPYSFNNHFIECLVCAMLYSLDKHSLST